MNLSLFAKGPVKVGIIGQGYVGLPLALLFAEAGVQTCGFDTDENKVRKLNAGKSFIDYIDSARIAKLVKKGVYRASNRFEEMGDYDALIICVPTPLDAHMQPDISYILRSGESIARTLRKGQLIVLESTTYPRCTREDLLPILEKTGLKLDKDFAVAFSPEREDPSNKSFNTRNIPKLVGGITEDSTRIAQALYSRAIEHVVPVASAEIAEASKLLENIFRSVNIALVNELKVVYDAMGIDVWEVIRAASTKPFGFMPFYPGPGLGGHCIPIDPFYLTWKAREYGKHTRFIELAGEINTAMPAYVYSRTTQVLNEAAKAVKGSRVLVVGLAYKANVDDMRESPSLHIMDLLHKGGASVDYYDPYIPEVPPNREHPHWVGKRSVPWNRKTVAAFDAVIIATAHDKVPYAELGKWAQAIVDTRDAMKSHAKAHAKVLKA